MAFFEWNDSIRVGVPLIDHDHQFLISLINQLHDAVGRDDERDVLETVLDALIEYTVYHFGREERVMEASGFPDLARHRVRHHELARKVLDAQQRFRDQRDSRIGGDLLDFLKDWLTSHIIGEDSRIRDFAAGNPVAIRAAAQVPRLVLNAPGGIGVPEVDWSALKVLVVEANPSFRKVLATILQTVEVAEVRESADGAAALAALGDFTPDVVVADWFVETMDGIEFLGAVRALRADLRVVPVVLLLGPDTREFGRQAKAAGVEETLEKPVTAKGLLIAVARAVMARG